VAFSADGNRLAVGAPSFKADDKIGFVQVFEWTGLAWSQVGNDYNGLTAADKFGSKLVFSSDGIRLAVAAPSWNDTEKGVLVGLVQVFEWTGSVWSQVSDDLTGTATNDQFGHALAFSSDGTRLAVGAYGNHNDKGVEVGLVQVFEWTGSSRTWSQIGDDLKGTTAHDWFGRGVALSANGTRLAIGAPSFKGAVQIGFVQIFEWTGLVWSQVGKDLNGITAADEFGSTLAFSSDGSRLVVAAAECNGDGILPGLVQVIDLDGTTCS